MVVKEKKLRLTNATLSTITKQLLAAKIALAMDDSTAAQILATFSTHPVVHDPSPHQDRHVPTSPLHLSSPHTDTTLSLAHPLQLASPKRTNVKKRGPLSKLDGAYFPHKLFRIIGNSKFLKWVDESNFQIFNYDGLLTEWKEQINEIKEQTMKDELRKHNFIRNRKLEKERGIAAGEIWFHRDELFRRGHEDLLDHIKRKYRPSKRGRTSSEEGEEHESARRYQRVLSFHQVPVSSNS